MPRAWCLPVAGRANGRAQSSARMARLHAPVPHRRASVPNRRRPGRRRCRARPAATRVACRRARLSKTPSKDWARSAASPPDLPPSPTWLQLAFVCATDMPFLHPAFIGRVLREFSVADTDVVLPMARGFRQPLAAVYRTSLAALIANLASGGELRPGMLFEHCRVRRIDDQQLLADAVLARFDADLESVMNLNSPDDYEAARARPPAEVTVQCFGALASAGHRGPRTVRAATLGGAARAVDIPLDRYVMAALNGDLMTRDPHLPLVAGDTVALLSADAGG